MVKTKVSTCNSALKMIWSGIPFSLNSILYFAVDREEGEETKPLTARVFVRFEWSPHPLLCSPCPPPPSHSRRMPRDEWEWIGNYIHEAREEEGLAGWMHGCCCYHKKPIGCQRTAHDEEEDWQWNAIVDSRQLLRSMYRDGLKVCKSC